MIFLGHSILSTNVVECLYFGSLKSVLVFVYWLSIISYLSANDTVRS
jgi:hypothetical protein